MFEFETMVKAKLIDVEVLSQKNRDPADDPGTKLAIECALGNDSLVLFDGSLKSFLYTKNANQSNGSQGNLELADAPNLTRAAQLLGQLAWAMELTGYTLTIETGIGRKESHLVLDDCVVDNFRLIPKEGGTFLVRFDCESQNVAEKLWGKLAPLKSREVSILLTPPEVNDQQGDVEDGDNKPTGRGRKARSEAAPVH